MLAVIFPGMSQLDPEQYPFRFAHERIRAVLEEESIPHLDLLETFLGKSEVRMSAYPGGDAHPSEIAHRIAAETIFEHLLETGMIDPAYRPQIGRSAAPKRMLRKVQLRKTPLSVPEPRAVKRKSLDSGPSIKRASHGAMDV